MARTGSSTDPRPGGLRVLDLRVLDLHEPDSGAEDAAGVYAELPPAADAAALVARTINPALAAERGPQDLSAAFRLHPVAVPETSAAGRPYRVLRWGVFVPDPDYADAPCGELVAYGAVRRRRDGQLRYDPRGLHDPLTADELDRFLAAAGDPRDGGSVLADAAAVNPAPAAASWTLW